MAKTKSQRSASQGKRTIDSSTKSSTSKRNSTDATVAKSSAKRSLASIGSLEQPRRSKRVKQLHLDKRDAIITPSPALLHQTKAKLPEANIKDVATDLLFARETMTDRTKSERPSTSCLSSLSSSSRFSEAASASAGSICHPELVLPPGVHSILCPYMKNHVTMRRTYITNESKVAKKLEMNSCETALAPCSCAFIYNDSSGIVNIESYLATYSQEYIASLYECEFNIEYVPDKFFPEHLRRSTGGRLGSSTDDNDNASATSDCKINSSVKGSDEESESDDSSRLSVVGSLEKRRSPRFQSSDESNDDSASFDSPSGRDSEATSMHDDDDSSSFSSLSPSASPVSHSSVASPTSFLSGAHSKASSSRSRVDTLSRQRFQYYMNYIAKLQQQSRSERKSLITSPIRAVLVDWLIEVAEEYRLGGVTLHTAVGLVDRCLANENCKLVKDVMIEKWKKDVDTQSWSDKGFNGRQVIIDRKTVQLLGCGCMMIACKMHERNPPEVKDFCFISGSQYSVREITKIEIEICTLLAFNLQIVTSHHFADIFLRASYVSGNGVTRPICSMGYKVEDNDSHSNRNSSMAFMVDYLMEIALLSHEFSQIEPSRVAAAAVYLARATFGIRDAGDASKEYGQGFFSRTLKFYSGYDTGDLKEIIMELYELHKKSQGATLKSVYDKFSKEKFGLVALKIPVEKKLLSESLDSSI